MVLHAYSAYPQATNFSHGASRYDILQIKGKEYLIFLLESIANTIGLIIWILCSLSCRTEQILSTGQLEALLQLHLVLYTVDLWNDPSKIRYDRNKSKFVIVH